MLQRRWSENVTLSKVLREAIVCGRELEAGNLDLVFSVVRHLPRASRNPCKHTLRIMRYSNSMDEWLLRLRGWDSYSSNLALAKPQKLPIHHSATSAPIHAEPTLRSFIYSNKQKPNTNHPNTGDVSTGDSMVVSNDGTFSRGSL